ncbi:MAG: hypothetical protein AAF191_02210, partial [Verrucomicrobiota bacterium]
RAGAYRNLIDGLSLHPDQLLTRIEASGECGTSRISTGAIWRAAKKIASHDGYVIAHATDQESGAFLDRVLLEEDPHTLLEGMILCGYASGSHRGIISIPAPYLRAIQVVEEAILEARKDGALGNDIYCSGFDFDVQVQVGEINSLFQQTIASEHPDSRTPEGQLAHLFGQHAIVNSLETLMRVPYLLENSEDFRELGTHASPGTKVLSLNAGFARPGLVEVEFGTTFREIIEDYAEGGRQGKPLLAVLIGGPSGSFLLPQDWDLPLCSETLDHHQIHLGDGGIIAVPQETDLRTLLFHLVQSNFRHAMPFPCAGSIPGILLNAAKQEQSVEELLRALKSRESVCRCGCFQLPQPIETLLSLLRKGQ